MKIKIFITIILLSTTTIIHAHFYKYALWGYKDEKGKTNFVHTLSDIHLSGGTNTKQRNELVVTARKKCGRENTLFIVEDIEHCYKVNKTLKDNFPLDVESFLKQLTVIFGLEKKLNKNSLTCKNTEIRSNHTMNYILTSPIPKESSCKGSFWVDAATFATALTKDLDQIKVRPIYHNDPIINAMCERLYANYKANRALLTKMRNLARSTASKARRDLSNPNAAHLEITPGMLLSCDKSNRFHKIFEILSQCEVIDIKTLHALANNRDKKHIFICQGGAHIDTIEELLPALGFKRLITCGQSTEESIKREGEGPAIAIKKLFNALPDNFDDCFNSLDKFEKIHEQFLEKPKKQLLSRNGITFTTLLLRGLFGLAGEKLGFDIINWYDRKQKLPLSHQAPSPRSIQQQLRINPLNPPITQIREQELAQAQPTMAPQIQQSTKSSIGKHEIAQTQQKRAYTTAAARILTKSTMLPTTQIGRFLIPRIKSAPFTTNRLLSRSLKFATFGLSLGALGAYAWLSK